MKMIDFQILCLGMTLTHTIALTTELISD